MPSVNLFSIHIITMLMSSFLMGFGLLISRYMKKKKWWLANHKRVGIAGAFLGGIGIAAMAVMIQLASGIHLRAVHSWFGLLALISFIVTPILGKLIFTSEGKERKARLRVIHRWSGRVTLLLMLAAIILGLFQTGILRI